MNNNNELQQNVSVMGAIWRLMLILPAGMIGAAAVVFLQTYILMVLPFYLLVTGLTYYSPVIHLYSLMHASTGTRGRSHGYASGLN